MPVDRLYALRAKGNTWDDQAKILGVTRSTIARWWRQLGALEEAGADPRGVNDPTPTPSSGPGPARAIFLDPDLDPADLTPEQRKRRFLRRVAIAEAEGGPDALKAVMADMTQLAKLEAEQSYAGVVSDLQHAALSSLCMRLAAYLQRRADPVSAARRVAEDKDAPPPERKAARQWLAEHPEDDELERLYRASAAATSAEEERDALAAWIDARPEIMREVLA